MVLNLRRPFCGHIKIGNRLYFSVKRVMRICDEYCICVLDSAAYVLDFFVSCGIEFFWLGGGSWW
jgi:hypothetical protein